MLVGMYGLWAPQKLIGRFKTDLKLVTEAIHLPESGQPWMGNGMFSVKFRDFWTPPVGSFFCGRGTLLTNHLTSNSFVMGLLLFLSTLDLDFDSPHAHKLMVEKGVLLDF